MKIIILNGNPYPDRKEFDGYVDDLLAGLKGAGHDAARFVLRDMKIRPCTGCFNCWVRTPGQCSFKDDAVELSRQYIHADVVIFASPLIMGFYSALLKNTLDRCIPLIHPYVENVDGEAHHAKRYDQYPKISFILEKEPFTDEEDIAIVGDIIKREIINTRSSLGFVAYTEQPVTEVLHAVGIH